MAGPRFPLSLLTPSHDVSAFTCGTRPGAKEIDDYLRVRALAEQTAGLSAVWVATDPLVEGRERRIAGYLTLSPLSIQISPTVLGHLGIQSPYRLVGGYLLGRLGVAEHLQTQGLGPILVAAAIKIAKQASREVGGAFLAVDPKNDGLLAWCESLDFGFDRIDPARRRLVLKL